MFKLKLPKYLATPFQVSFLFSSMMTLGILAIYFRLQPQLPLFYSLATKSQHLANKEWLFLFPGFSFFMSFFHLLIAQTTKKFEPLLLKIFAWTTVGLQLILSLALFRIIMITT